MPVEVYQSANPGSYYTWFDDYGWELANFFSGSVNFTIIDSYSSARSLRYKGDPIADDDPGRPGTKYWDTVSDVGKSNDWIVVQCETTIHGALGLPKWQVKIQWSDSVAFDDVSGLDYGQEGSTRVFLARFAPKGGWDLADTNPDFAPAGSLYKSSQNRNFSRDTGDADSRWLLVANDGQLMNFDRKGSTSHIAENFIGYMGDYTPIDPTTQLMPRFYQWGGNANLLSTAASNGYLAHDNNVVGPNDQFGGLGWENPAGLWVTSGFTNPGFGQFLDAYSQPCRHALSQEVDMVPYYLIPSDGTGLIGTTPMVMRGYGPGFTLLAGKQWLSLGDGNTPFVNWDGVTALNF